MLTRVDALMEACKDSLHNPLKKKRLHKLFKLKAVLNQKIFLMSHPPHNFGFDNFSQLAS